MVTYEKVVWMLAAAWAGCGNASRAHHDDPMPPGAESAVHLPDGPKLGAHGIAFHRFRVGSPTTITSPVLATRAHGSTMIVSVGRGNRYVFEPPTDNKDNAPSQQLDTVHAYTRWRDSGTAVYAFPNIKGGSGHVVRNRTPSDDEITLAAVEVTDATRIREVAWREVLEAPLTSGRVTTTGPAMLVAFWWGDAGVGGEQAAVPGDGFLLIDSVLAQGALVQSAVAVKQVSEAGTYEVTWSARPAQGAQLWLIAVE